MVVLAIYGCTKKENLTGPAAASTVIPQAQGQPTMVPTQTGPDLFFGGSNTLTVNCLIKTSDGGYAVSGNYNGYSNGFILKVDGAGNQQWLQIYAHRAEGIVQSPDNGFLAADGSSGVFKTDQAGILQWSKNYSGAGTGFWGLYYAANVATGYVIADDQFKILNIDAAGNSLWSKDFNPPGGGYVDSFISTSDSGFMLAGSVYSGVFGYSDIFALKADQNGNIVFSGDYGTITNDSSNSVVEMGLGTFGIYGQTRNNPPEKDLLITIGPTGTQNLFKVMGASNPLEAVVGLNIISAGGGNYMLQSVEVCKIPQDPYYLVYILLKKIDSSGNVLWDKYYYSSTGLNDNTGFKICASGDGGFVMAGTTTNPQNSMSQAYLMKVDASGNRVW